MLMNGNTAEIRSKNVSPKVFLCRISRANICKGRGMDQADSKRGREYGKSPVKYFNKGAFGKLN